MSGNISVVYEKGVLKPLAPLNLPEQTHLEIRILQTTENGLTEAKQAYQVLLRDGLIQPLHVPEDTSVPENERLRAANIYGQAGPLSEMIIAEREGR